MASEISREELEKYVNGEGREEFTCSNDNEQRLASYALALLDRADKAEAQVHEMETRGDLWKDRCKKAKDALEQAIKERNAAMEIVLAPDWSIAVEGSRKDLVAKLRDKGKAGVG